MPRNMALTVKFVYVIVLFISIFFVAPNIGGKLFLSFINNFCNLYTIFYLIFKLLYFSFLLQYLLNVQVIMIVQKIGVHCQWNISVRVDIVNVLKWPCLEILFQHDSVLSAIPNEILKYFMSCHIVIILAPSYLNYFLYFQEPL